MQSEKWLGNKPRGLHIQNSAFVIIDSAYAYNKFVNVSGVYEFITSFLMHDITRLSL